MTETAENVAAEAPWLTVERLGAVTDGIIAIIVTILVLGIEVPKGHDFDTEGIVSFLWKVERPISIYLVELLFGLGLLVAAPCHVPLCSADKPNARLLKWIVSVPAFSPAFHNRTGWGVSRYLNCRGDLWVQLFIEWNCVVFDVAVLCRESLSPS